MKKFVRTPFGHQFRDPSRDRWQAGFEWARGKFPSFDAEDPSAIDALEKLKRILEGFCGPMPLVEKRVRTFLSTVWTSDPDILRTTRMKEVALAKGATRMKGVKNIPGSVSHVWFDKFWEGVHDWAVQKANELYDQNPERNDEPTRRLRLQLWQYAGLPGEP